MSDDQDEAPDYLAMPIPPNAKIKGHWTYRLDGKEISLTDLCRLYASSEASVVEKLAHGWDIRDALAQTLRPYNPEEDGCGDARH